MYKPENDGIDHINIYSKGKTELGRKLSNFQACKLITEDGCFTSIEGYWYWLNTNHKDRDILRTKYGFEAKKVGRELQGKDWNDDPEFKRKIRSAIRIKIFSNDSIYEQLKLNKLPLTHYYVYGNKVINVSEADWILDIIREVQDELR